MTVNIHCVQIKFKIVQKDEKNIRLKMRSDIKIIHTGDMLK